MLTFESIDVVFITAAFLVPGFIWSAVLSMLVPRRARATEVRFLEFLTLSCINHALWGGVTYAIIRSGFAGDHPWWTGLLIFLAIGASPVVLGFLTGRWLQTDWIKTFLGRFGFRTIHPIPTAWDYHFSRTGPCWVLVTFKGGERVYGLFHNRSFAGDDPSERDLYLEAVFKPTDSGEWAPVEDSEGILIKGDQIAAIEFRKFME